MKPGFLSLALILGLGLAAPVLAQEEPKKEEPAKEETAAPEAAAEAAPAKEAEPAKEEPAKPAAAATPAAAAAPAPELSGCAKAFTPLADSYKSAYDDMQKWIGQINTETAAAGEKVKTAQAAVQANETATTQAKLANDSAKAKDLQKANKKLWDDLNAAKKGQSDACAKFAKEAPQRVKQYTDATNTALNALKAQTK